MPDDQTSQPVSQTTPSPTGRPLWWRLLGIKRRQGRFVRVKPSLWGWLLILLLGGGVGFAGFVEYSMQPDFCRSCHIMEPYYQAWHQSTHKNVPCTDCHFEPGLEKTIEGKWQASSQAVKFITNTYQSKPHAEVRDASCLREGCHEHRLLEGSVNWTIKNEHGEDVTIHFDHKPHLTELRRGKQLRCVSCHSQMVQGQHIVVTLDTCFLCHFKGFEHGRNDQTLGGCQSCHDAPAKTVRLSSGEFDHAKFIDRGVECINCHADTILGNGNVPRQVCWNCHNQPQHLAKYGETTLIHKKHVSDKKVECASCHVQIEHRLEAAGPAGIKLLGGGAQGMADTGACGQCHSQTHNGALDMYRGVGGRGVPDMPSPMYRAQVDCIACHKWGEHPEQTAEVVGQTFVANQASCDHCHDARYNDVLAGWRVALSQQLAEAHQAIDHAQKVIDKLANDPTVESDKKLELRKLFDDAQYNTRIVELGHGVHNITYATALLNVALDNCNRIAPGSAPANTPGYLNPLPQQDAP
ncbi:MAG: hypothetical protein GC164_08000 [Phycisphaera sp.]|nr:hypothetical protein [Phycisphaera sp.]